MSREKPWIGVDLDGTLARYDGWKGPSHIGEPVERMLARVNGWLAEGQRVKIFTARASHTESRAVVYAWLEKHGLGDLEVTNVKDFAMTELWDDRAVQVVLNTGERVGNERFAEPEPVTHHTRGIVPGTPWSP